MEVCERRERIGERGEWEGRGGPKGGGEGGGWGEGRMREDEGEDGGKDRELTLWSLSILIGRERTAGTRKKITGR